MKIRMTITVKGLVQGVNFRYFTQQEARRHEVTGWVENRPNGEVAGCFEGEEREVTALVEWCRQGPPAARVDGVETVREEFTGEFAGFMIRR